MSSIPSLAAAQRSSTVGMPARIEQIILPGTELEAKPIESARTPVVLRVAGVYPHGTAFRYDLVYYALEPGTFDLKDYLRRKDGSSTANLPSIAVQIHPLLPPGQIEPHNLESNRSPFRIGYKTLLILGGSLWLIGLAAIVFVRRRKLTEGTDTDKPLTIADRLRPLVEGAVAGRLSQQELADLERTLLAYWRRRLGLEDMKPAGAIAHLRKHEEAGPLLEQLETWLHRPGTAANIEVSTLLKPYQNLPAEELDA